MTTNDFPLQTLRCEQFADLLGEDFAVLLPKCSQLLTLTEARAGRGPGPFGRTPFRLLFRGRDPKIQLAQCIHGLRHPRCGLLEIFLVTVGCDEEGRFLYQASFT